PPQGRRPRISFFEGLLAAPSPYPVYHARNNPKSPFFYTKSKSSAMGVDIVKTPAHNTTTGSRRFLPTLMDSVPWRKTNHLISAHPAPVVGLPFSRPYAWQSPARRLGSLQGKPYRGRSERSSPNSSNAG